MAKLKAFPQAWALEVQEDIFSWLGTRAGYIEVLTNYANMYRKANSTADVPDTEMVRLVESWMPGIMVKEGGAVFNPPPTFCTADYVSMLMTMATAAPVNSLRTADITHPEGLLVLEVPVTLELPRGAPDIERVRALSWYTAPGESGTNTLGLYTRVWTETRLTPSTPQIRSRHKLFPSPLAASKVSAVQVEGENHILTQLLQAHFALLKSPLAAEEPSERDPKVSPRTKRSLGDSLRRVYLRRPEYARYEADEASAASEGRAPMRAHWVRGHWRNQPYPKLQETRWIWIDGHIKGNPEIGTVSDRKVGVARASRTDLRELAGAAA